MSVGDLSVSSVNVYSLILVEAPSHSWDYSVDGIM